MKMGVKNNKDKDISLNVNNNLYIRENNINFLNIYSKIIIFIWNLYIS